MQPDESIQSKGGRARADALSDNEKSSIARTAALARWDVPKAEYGAPERPLRIGNLEIPCYVLDDGRRVITQGGALSALSMSQGTATKGGGDRLTNFLGTKSLNPFVSSELAKMITPIRFRPPTGGVAYGYDAKILPEICDTVLEARGKDALNYQQLHIAKQCEILVRAFARVGIVALVDEATGYQAARNRDALQKILDKYLTDEWAKWTKTFPDEYYEQLFRLHSIEYPTGTGTKRPGYVGHWTNDIVYDRLAPGIKDELKKKNPRTDTGNRARAHHQHLTREIGHPALREHISNVIFLMRTCKTWDEFKDRLDEASPKFGDTLKLALSQ
ncbi:MAG: P63C domain-containing protein [Chthoniobacter sp.]|nr:P63C domain-containing protein [Chthoniobacter sp.]